MDWKEEMEKLKKSPKYQKVYMKASGKMREMGMYIDMPGFALYIQASCIQSILKYERDEDIFELLEKVMLVPASPVTIKDIHPIEQWMTEALRASGIKEEPMEFLKKLVIEIEKEIK